MQDIRAFVGHSFLSDDQILVRKFTDYFDVLSKSALSFSWDHALPAEPSDITKKVLNVFKGKNLFIGICTKNERVVKEHALSKWHFGNKLSAPQNEFKWKTSDWIIQEIGLAIGKKLDLILLVENGVDSLGGLQGNLEHIPFDRNSPEESFGRILEMINSLSLENAAIDVRPEAETTVSTDDNQSNTSSDNILTEPEVDWPEDQFKREYFFTIVLKDHDHRRKVEDKFLETEMASDAEILVRWNSYRSYIRLVHSDDYTIDELKEISVSNPKNMAALEYFARGLEEFGDYKNAANKFELRAKNTEDNVEKLASFSDSARNYHLAGLDKEAHACLQELKVLAQNNEDLEAKMLIEGYGERY